MDCYNKHPNKKIKVDVLKVENVPVFFTNYGSRCTDERDTWAYLQAPNWQKNPYENTQLHEQVFRKRKPNVSYFEMLPNELFQDLFEYLPLIDLFRNFYYLNQRFRLLVQYQLTQQARLRLDFSSLSLREFDFIRSQVNPKKVERLTIGNWDMSKIDETCSFGQISLFLYHYNLSQFSSLTSLRIISPEDNNQHLLLLNQLPEKQLKHLYIRFRNYSQKNLDLCVPFMDTIESITLDKVILTDLIMLSQINFKHLQYLYINYISEYSLLALLPGTPRLRYLKVVISNHDDTDMLNIKYNNFELLNMMTLYIESKRISWKYFEVHLLCHMPNLRRLFLIGDYLTPVEMLGKQWKECFLKYTPHLIDFRFDIDIRLNNQLSDIDEILEPFREEFWQERKWYAAAGVYNERILHLYSLPRPSLNRSSRITTSVPLQLTCHSMAYLNASTIKKDISTTLIYTRPPKIRSFNIPGSGWKIISEQLLVNFSSIYELSVTENVDPVYFFNILNTMTQLKSLRLIRDSVKILLALKENPSWMKSLQKCAIRKLVLYNVEEVEDLTIQGAFPLDEFIQVFCTSLESLCWIRPPILVPVYSLINSFPKLKSLVTYQANVKISRDELIQWIQKNTRLNTLVAKSINNGEHDIWHLWF